MVDMVEHLQTYIAEDTVEYRIFPIHVVKGPENDQRNALEKLLEEVNTFVSDLIKDYLWHVDPFRLVIRTSAANVLESTCNHLDVLPAHLYGLSYFGDNIDDEWFIVHLLRLITLKFESRVAVRVQDSFGEFLLVEGAKYLSGALAKPEVCHNRVFLFDGSVHVICNTKEQKCITELLYELEDNTHAKVVRPIDEFQKVIQIRGEEAAAQKLHKSTVLVPRKVAAILTAKPHLIGHAVRAFCQRDPIDVKTCRRNEHFPSNDLVSFRITFTRCMYAMMLFQKQECVRNWTVDRAMHDQKMIDLGIKVTLGFEILLNQNPIKQNSSEQKETDRAWLDYVQKLEQRQYFGDYLPHSKPYIELLARARFYYREHLKSIRITPNISIELAAMLNDPTIVEYSSLASSNGMNEDDDDDSWLTLAPHDLDQMLKDRYGENAQQVDEKTTDAKAFTTKLNTFFNKMSDVEGIDYESSSQHPVNSNRIDFDPNAFGEAMRSILDFVVPEEQTDESDSDDMMDDYGDDAEHESDDDPTSTNCKPRPETNHMKQYMREMDRQLANTTIGQSFRTAVDPSEEGDDDRLSPSTSFDDIEDFEPVDINVNALKNVLASYRAQMGEAGPSTSMLGPMGIYVDDVSAEDAAH